jgi:predicted HTH domain antitoxin
LQVKKVIVKTDENLKLQDGRIIFKKIVEAAKINVKEFNKVICV